MTVRGFGPDFKPRVVEWPSMPTSTIDQHAGRSFDFGNLASEGISSVRVYKSGKADVPTGGIGATIDIRTTRPLEDPGFKADCGHLSNAMIPRLRAMIIRQRFRRCFLTPLPTIPLA